MWIIQRAKSIRVPHRTATQRGALALLCAAKLAEPPRLRWVTIDVLAHAGDVSSCFRSRHGGDLSWVAQPPSKLGRVKSMSLAV